MSSVSISQLVDQIIRKHHIKLYDFYAEDLFTYVLRTDEKVMPELLTELQFVFPPSVIIRRLPLRDLPQYEVSGVAAEDIEAWDLVYFQWQTGRVFKARKPDGAIGGLQ